MACEYCDGSYTELPVVGADLGKTSSVFLDVMPRRGQLNVTGESPTGEMSARYINFCPMCGRLLPGAHDRFETTA